jgi:hypothetical protein
MMHQVMDAHMQVPIQQKGRQTNQCNLDKSSKWKHPKTQHQQ